MCRPDVFLDNSLYTATERFTSALDVSINDAVYKFTFYLLYFSYLLCCARVFSESTLKHKLHYFDLLWIYCITSWHIVIQFALKWVNWLITLCRRW